jgi:CRISPR-associated protein Cas1
MELILTTPGAYLSIKDGLFCIASKEQKASFSPLKIERIILTTHSLITTEVIKVCNENNIDLIILDDSGDPVGRFWHAKYGSTSLIRRKQIELAENDKGFDIVRGWIIEKIKNQIEFLNELAKNREKLSDFLYTKAKLIEECKEKMMELKGNLQENRNQIIGIEGNASNIYFQAISECMPDKYKFKGRSRQPAKDEFNALLNYVYGILYSTVTRACIVAGLDPYAGFLHTDNYNKKSLVFDVIEKFRIFGDKVVVYMFSRKLVNDSYFDNIKNGFSLNKDGKKALFTEYNQFMDKIVHFGNKNMKRRDCIQAFCHQFANSLIKEK